MPGYIKLKPQETFDYRSIPNRIKLDYAHGLKDPNQRALEGIQRLLAHFRTLDMNIDGLLTEAADLIWRHMSIDNVAIGLRDPKDGMYRYRAMVGFRPDALEGHKRIAYSKEQFYANSEFNGTDVGNCSRIYLAEDNPLTEVEKKAFNRPGLLAMRRQTSSDSLEGDYIDTRICGVNDELLGWIEISGTRTLKLPEASTIRWVEAIAGIIAAAIICQSGHKVREKA